MYEEMAKKAYHTWRSNLNLSLVPLLWSLISGMLLLALFLAVIALGFVTMVALSPIGSSVGMVAGIFVGVLASAVALLAFTYANAAYSATFFTMADSLLGRKPLDISQSFDKSRPLWGRFFWFSILQSVVFLAAVLVSALPFLACLLLPVFGGNSYIWALLAGGTISVLVLVAAFIYLTLLFLFSFPILLYEKGSSMELLTKCRQMLHGRMKHTLFSFAVVWLVSFGFSMVLGIILSPFTIASFFIPFIGMIPSTISSILSAVVLQPWAALFLIIAYKKK